MAFKIFYSWQAKLIPRFNRNFIEDALKDAIKQLKKELNDVSPDFYLDRDTKDIPGLPNIPMTIKEKVRFCDVFVGDVTFIAYTDTNIPQANRTLKDRLLGRNKWIREGVYSTNVAEELGTAIGGARGSERVITIMNTAYGTPDQLNFDSKQSRFPLTYHYDVKTTDEQRANEKKKLIAGLKERIRLILETEHERQKEYFAPFITWKGWEKIINRPFQFELTEYIQGVFTLIKSNVNNPKVVYRLCGLSGIGKTRMLFECFINSESEKLDELSNKVLYADLNDFDDKSITKACKELLLKQENKIIIVDNCTKELHNSLAAIISNQESKLSLITISTDPDERINELDHDQITRLIILDNGLCKKIVEQILRRNFNEFQEDEQNLLVEFSSGISLVAAIMAQNPDRGKYQPGSLTREHVVKRLLGPAYADENFRSAIYACSLFSKFGFFDDLAFQTERIARNADVFEINESGINKEDLPEWRVNNFRRYCEALHSRQLLEKRGRTFSFRPSPLAVRMAETWWQNCTKAKFERILPFLKEAQLVDSFCEQFKYLKHVENAKSIVQNLCNDFFSLAEVLNTYVGSRLFRSFVYVNPVACASALTNAFLNLTPDQLQKIDEGRRNLVWALEKLCFRPETYFDSAKVMAAFAIAENENIGNNSTHQFLQLFHIYLAGTSVNLEERWKLIEYCFQKDDVHKKLGLQALASAISVGQFGRMGGAEDQGDPIPLQDYKPSGPEIHTYWQKAIARLENIALASGPFQAEAVKILNDSFYGLCAHYAGRLIIPVIKNLLNIGLLDRMDMRTKVQFIINSGRVSDRETFEELSQIFNELMPLSFVDKFRILIQQPSHAEYIDDEKIEAYGKKLGIKIKEFTSEFLDQSDKWNEYANLFVSGQIAEGYNFGKYISQKADHNAVNELVKILLEKLKNTTPTDRNISILLGILVQCSDKEYVRKVFYQVAKDEGLKTLAFDLARAIQLLPEDIFFLLDETESGNFTVEYFRVFTYGWGLQHLLVDDTIRILNRIRQLGENGKVVAFFILFTWANDNSDIHEKFRELIRDCVLRDSDLIFDHLRNTLDVNYYVAVVLKMLSEWDDKELASAVIKTIIDQSNKQEDFYGKEFGFIKLLNFLQEKYFPILWQGISEMYLNIDKYALAAFHFKSLLGSKHDFQGQSDGILFKGDPKNFDTIFEWCKNHRGNELYWISELLPLFNEERSSDNEWHPYAMKFLNEFGDDRDFLSAISANLGTFGWTGTIVPKLKSDRVLFEKLLDHKIKLVREWAQLNIDDLDKRIKWESDRDEDGIIPGYLH